MNPFLEAIPFIGIVCVLCLVVFNPARMSFEIRTWKFSNLVISSSLYALSTLTSGMVSTLIFIIILIIFGGFGFHDVPDESENNSDIDLLADPHDME